MEREGQKKFRRTQLQTRFPRWCSGKEYACQCRRSKRFRFNPWVRKILCSRKWQPTPVFLPWKFHGQRSLVGYSTWGCKVLDMTETARTASDKCEILLFKGYLCCFLKEKEECIDKETTFWKTQERERNKQIYRYWDYSWLDNNSGHWQFYQSKQI